MCFHAHEHVSVEIVGFFDDSLSIALFGPTVKSGTLSLVRVFRHGCRDFVNLSRSNSAFVTAINFDLVRGWLFFVPRVATNC